MDTGLLEHINKITLEVLDLLNIGSDVLRDALCAP